MESENQEYTDRINNSIELMHQDKFNEAIDILDELIILKPDDFILYALKGQVNFVQDKYEEAVPFYKKVLELKPKSEGASAYLFHCLNGMGQGDDALNEMKRFLNSVDELKKDSYKWILEDLLNSIDRQLCKSTCSSKCLVEY